MRITLLLLTITFPVFGQSPRVDSLENLLNKSTVDTTKINLLVEIAMEVWSSSPEKTLASAQKALDLSKKIDYPKGEAAGEHVLGVYYWQKNNYPEALAHYSKSEEIAR